MSAEELIRLIFREMSFVELRRLGDVDYHLTIDGAAFIPREAGALLETILNGPQASGASDRQR